MIAIVGRDISIMLIAIKGHIKFIGKTIGGIPGISRRYRSMLPV
jgi:hypothetical protein